MSWNLPPVCTDEDIDRAFGDYDDPRDRDFGLRHCTGPDCNGYVDIETPGMRRMLSHPRPGLEIGP